MLTASSCDQCTVVVVGAINVDMVVSAAELPRAGQTVVGAGPARHGGGKAANAAVAAARSGASVALIGAVGNDQPGAEALADLRQEGVDIKGVAVLDGVPTGMALIVVDGSGENQIAVGAGANGALQAGWVATRITEALGSGTGCVLVSTEIPDDAVAAAVRAAAAARAPCVLNTAPPTAVIHELVEDGPLLTPNVHELELLTRLLGASRVPRGTNGVAEQAVALARRTGRAVVVTMGADGALAAAGDGSVEVFAAPHTVVVDTTGAGDTFNGVLAAGLAQRDSLANAVRIAVLAASISVSQPGARGARPDQIELGRAVVAERPQMRTESALLASRASFRDPRTETASDERYFPGRVRRDG